MLAPVPHRLARGLALSAVVTRLALAGLGSQAGCHKPHADGAAGAPDAHADGPTFTFDRRSFPRLLNPTGAESTEFFAGSGDGCRRARTPHPEHVPDLTSAELVPCPDALRDPAWNGCAEGSMFASSDKKKCSCVTGGASPHATDVACPGSSK